MPADTAPLLAIRGIEVVYDHVILALRGLSLTVQRGRIVALLGANGAGKSTTLKAISHVLAAERGQVTRGTIDLDGVSTADLSTADLVAKGVVQVLEGRHCFRQLTIEENLVTGAIARRPSKADLAADLERIYGFFPRLKAKRRIRAGYTSGGEQQMCAIGRALMSRPRLIVLDEPSMGLAPKTVEEIFGTLGKLNAEEGLSLLIAEQNAAVALRYAHTACIIENGRVVLEGPSAAIRERDDVEELYFGLGGEARVSFRDRRTTPAPSWLL